jgi:hypothetical protein
VSVVQRVLPIERVYEDAPGNSAEDLDVNRTRQASFRAGSFVAE